MAVSMSRSALCPYVTETKKALEISMKRKGEKNVNFNTVMVDEIGKILIK